MNSISEFFYKPCVLPCPDCGNDISISGLSKHMWIAGIEGCEWTIYKYAFFDDVYAQCSKCHNKYKVSGSVYDGPDEGYVSHYLKLEPVEETKDNMQ